MKAIIEASGFTTRNPIRDLHVRSRMFLGVKNPPTWTYESNSVAPIRSDDLVVLDRARERRNT